MAIFSRASIPCSQRIPTAPRVLRAMLLGDRSFVDSDVVLRFQKTSAYHVLVVAGLHVGALVIFLYWLGRRLHFSAAAIALMTLVTLAGYVGIVQDRPPILRAALIAAFYLCARPLFRRIELLNTLSLAALVILAVEAFFALRFKLPTFISRRRSHRRPRPPLDGPHQRALSRQACGTSVTSPATPRIRRKSRNSESKCAPRRTGWLSAFPSA